jgi:hypothetical protein
MQKRRISRTLLWSSAAACATSSTNTPVASASARSGPTLMCSIKIKGISTAWFLGGSLSYGFVNLTQLGVTLWPELGAKHGFVEAAKAISRATPLAFKIMKEVFKHGKR